MYPVRRASSRTTSAGWSRSITITGNDGPSAMKRISVGLVKAVSRTQR